MKITAFLQNDVSGIPNTHSRSIVKLAEVDRYGSEAGSLQPPLVSHGRAAIVNIVLNTEHIDCESTEAGISANLSAAARDLDGAIVKTQ